MSTKCSIDFISLKQYMDGEVDLFKELAHDLKNSYQDYLTPLKIAINNNDFDNIVLHAHTMKGLFRNFFLKSLESTCYEIEQMGVNKKLCDNVQVLLEGLEQEIPGTLSELITLLGNQAA